MSSRATQERRRSDARLPSEVLLLLLCIPGKTADRRPRAAAGTADQQPAPRGAARGEREGKKKKKKEKKAGAKTLVQLAGLWNKISRTHSKHQARDDRGLIFVVMLLFFGIKLANCGSAAICGCGCACTGADYLPLCLRSLAAQARARWGL